MTTLSIIIPVHNGAHFLPPCLEALRRSVRRPDEVIVVDDGSTDGAGAVAETHGARVVTLAGRSGAAAARNAGAEIALGDVLVFVDADVCVHPDALARIEQCLEEAPPLWAVVGAYDATPAADSPVSRFRNLLHTYTHSTGGRRTRTFWTGLGAVRAAAMARVGGFPATTLEDVAFGVLLADAGGAIALEPEISGTHLKRWTIASAVTTDILRRGTPWVRMALAGVDMGDNLNTRASQRWSVALVGLLLLAFAAAFVTHEIGGLASLAATLASLWLPNWPDADAQRPILRAGLLFTAFGIGAGALITLFLPLYAAVVYAFAALVAAFTTARAHKNARGLPLAAATIASLVAALSTFPPTPTFMAMAALAVAYVALNLGFLRFVARHSGLAAAIGATPLLGIYHLCCGASVALGLVLHGVSGGAPPRGLAGASTPSR